MPLGPDLGPAAGLRALILIFIVFDHIRRDDSVQHEVVAVMAVIRLTVLASVLQERKLRVEMRG